MIINSTSAELLSIHYDVIKWKHFPRYWPFVRKNHQSPVNFPHKGQWRGALMFSLICVWINGWVNHREAGDLRCYRAHYKVTVMYSQNVHHFVQASVCWEACDLNKSFTDITYWKLLFQQTSDVISDENVIDMMTFIWLNVFINYCS